MYIRNPDPTEGPDLDPPFTEQDEEPEEPEETQPDFGDAIRVLGGGIHSPAPQLGEEQVRTLLYWPEHKPRKEMDI